VKKTYLLNITGKNSERLLDASKHDIRKYVKRERARALPAGVDFWNFDCKLGKTESAAVDIHFAALITSIDTLVAEGAEQFYAEVVTSHGRRTSKPVDTDIKNTVETDFE
jgi:hypothetical protein